MASEKYTKKIYDKFGKEYQRTRDEKYPSRAYNEFYELPSMVKAVGNIKGKKLLDIGCGAGVHVKKYMTKGAKCQGMDISKTMIELAKEKCPRAEFKVGTMTKLPYKNNQFDIVTSSLAINYVKYLKKAFLEINRVLKKNGLFYFSAESPVSYYRERHVDKNTKISAVGYIKNKKTGKELILGEGWPMQKYQEFDMVPGMTIKDYRRSLRNIIQTLVKTNFELIDIIDCRATTQFKRISPEGYARVEKFPLFSIYVTRKKK